MAISSRPIICARALVSPLEIRLVRAERERKGVTMVKFTANPIKNAIARITMIAMVDPIMIGCVSDGPTVVTVLPVAAASSTTRCQLFWRLVNAWEECHKTL